jgi:hypothetical protein
MIVPSEEVVYHHIVSGINPEQGQVMLQHFTLAHKKQREIKTIKEYSYFMLFRM